MAKSGWCLVAKTAAEHEDCRYPGCTCTCHGGEQPAPATESTEESTDS